MPPRARPALTLIELLASLMIIAAIALIAIPRIAGRGDDARRSACALNRGEIELQALLWRRATGFFPTADLGAIGASAAYFPQGLPTCPVDGGAYAIDPSSGRVIGHNH